MGSGKTTVGRRVAKLLARDFVDADEALEEATGRSIAEIFGEDGEDAFRALELQVLHDLLARPAPTVIAAGGGVVVREEARDRLRGRDVTVVWLDATPAFLASRIETKAHRPLLAGAEPPRAVLERLDAARRPLYAEVADIVVDVVPFHVTEDRPKDALAGQIARQVAEGEDG
jgi:shikimate kinase